VARISVEQTALTDSRYRILAGILGIDHHSAIGRMLLIWNECQERETYSLKAVVIDALFGLEGAAKAVVEADLGEPLGVSETEPLGVNTEIRVRGTRGRIEWLARRRKDGREGGKKGGRPRKKTPGGLRAETPPAPAPAPTRKGDSEKRTYSDAQPSTAAGTGSPSRDQDRTRPDPDCPFVPMAERCSAPGCHEPLNGDAWHCPKCIDRLGATQAAVGRLKES
jgi:hypothetical protein